MYIGNLKENGRGSESHCFWDAESQEITECFGVASVTIGYAKTEREARAFIES